MIYKKEDKMIKEFRIEVAKRKRKCLHCNSEIEKGETCLVFCFYGRLTVKVNICKVCLNQLNKELYHMVFKTI